MTKSDLTLLAKLRNIQHELKAPKSQYNTFGKYPYRNQEDILDAAKPLCVKYEATLTVSDEIIQVGDRYYIKASATLEDDTFSKTVTGLAREDDEKKGMDASQLTGATSSYARKYALSGLFDIDDSKDADTEEHANQQQTKAKKPVEPAAKQSKVTKQQMTLMLQTLKQKGYEDRSECETIIRTLTHVANLAALPQERATAFLKWAAGVSKEDIELLLSQEQKATKEGE